MNRRQFLRAGGAAAAAGLAPSLTGAAAPGDDVRVAVIGTGVRGIQLIGFLNELPQFRVAAVCDVLPFRLDEARALAPKARATKDYRRVLDDTDVDAVVIATTFSEHGRIALDALDAGKHVYCEKTMAKGIDSALEVAAAAERKSGQIFQTGFQYHSSPLYRRAAAMVRRGEIGDVVAVDCQWNRNGDWRRAVPQAKYERQINWRMYRAYSGGLVAELSAHQMDFCNTILGSRIASVQGTGGVDFWKDGRETYDNVHVVCRYRSGVTATFTSLTANSMDNYRIAVLGSEGSLVLTTRRGWVVPEAAANDGVDLVSGASVADGSQSNWRMAANRAARRIDAPDTDPTPDALGDFSAAILAGRQPASDVRVGALASIQVQMALDAMDRRTVISWQDGYDV